jgi:hypothetical protein
MYNKQGKKMEIPEDREREREREMKTDIWIDGQTHR